MATYKTKVAFSFRRLKGFLKQFKRTKRGLIGLIVIFIVVLIALIGPSLTIYDPLTPEWPGYYPAGPAPACSELAVPFWYKYIPGNEYSENIEVVSDYQFSSEQAMNKWNWEINQPGYVSKTYNPVKGSHNDGAVELSYRRQSGDISPKEAMVKMNYSFTYPYKKPPMRFWIHMSYFVNGTVSKNSQVLFNVLFYRKDTSPLVNYTYPPPKYEYLITNEGSLTVYKYPLTTYTLASVTPMWTNVWLRSTSSQIFEDTKYYLNPEGMIFPTAGNYVFSIETIFKDDGVGAKDITVYLDNLNVLMYGSAFGLLGSDMGIIGQPRDIFTSLVEGARVSVMIGILTAVISVSLGLLLGITAGYVGGLTDEAIMRVGDFLIGLPGLPLLIVLAVILKPSVWNLVAILTFMGWMGFSRSVRSMTLSLRETAFIEAAKASGASRTRILLRHIVPNVFPLVYLALATSVPGAIVAEASLSFLGLYDPTRITWGRMLNEFTRSGIAVTKGFTEYWFWVLPPGIAISTLAISFILLGFSLDEILNPKLRQRR